MTVPSRAHRPAAVVVPSGEGELITAAGVGHLFRLTGATTAGRFALEEFALPADTVGARPHVHHSHDEYFYVLTGRLIVDTDAGEVILGPGDIAAAPRESVHGFRTGGAEGVTGLCMFTPAGYEQYFRDVHAAQERGEAATPELLASMRAGYDTTTLGG